MSSVAMRKKKLRRAAIRMTDASTQNGRDWKGPEQDRRTLSQKMRTERASPACPSPTVPDVAQAGTACTLGP